MGIKAKHIGPNRASVTDAGRKQAIAESASFIIRFIFLPNIAFLILRPLIYFDRPLINLDYIGLGLIAPLLSKGVNFALFVLWLLLDCFVSATSIFHLPLSDMIRAMPSSPNLSLFMILPLTLPVLVIAILLAKITSLCRSPQSLRTVALGISLLLAFLLINLTSASGVLASRLGMEGCKFSGSAVWRFAYVTVQDFRKPSLNRQDFWKTFSATSKIKNELDISPHSVEGKVVLVVVESWGYSKIDQLRNHMVAPFFSESIRNRYRITKGVVPFEGSTVAAELRELCGIRAGIRESRLDDKTLGECLPSKFARAGYATTAIHGFKQGMFQRNLWYPNVGFQQEYFMDNWPIGAPSRLSGSLFVGICDTDSGELLRRELFAGPSKHFLYWLTLDSHLQFDGRSQFKCSEQIPASICDLTSRLHQVATIIAGIASDPKLPRTRFIVVGDHSPPLMELGLRGMFSANEVPFIELTPR